MMRPASCNKSGWPAGADPLTQRRRFSSLKFTSKKRTSLAACALLTCSAIFAYGAEVVAAVRHPRLQRIWRPSAHRARPVRAPRKVASLAACPVRCMAAGMREEDCSAASGDGDGLVEVHHRKRSLRESGARRRRGAASRRRDGVDTADVFQDVGVARSLRSVLLRGFGGAHAPRQSETSDLSRWSSTCGYRPAHRRRSLSWATCP